MKRLTGTIALTFIACATALAFNGPSQKINLADKEVTEFTIMQMDAHLVLSKYARMQARNTKYTIATLSSRISFDYKVALHNDSWLLNNPPQHEEALGKGRNE